MGTTWMLAKMKFSASHHVLYHSFWSLGPGNIHFWHILQVILLYKKFEK